MRVEVIMLRSTWKKATDAIPRRKKKRFHLESLRLMGARNNLTHRNKVKGK